MMESRKAAPALRARLLRSYVPLRRDPNERELSGTIPGLPGCAFPLTISNLNKKNEDRTLSADTRLYSALLFESRCIFLFQKRRADKQLS